MTSFALVHGAWHGGWCWDEVRRHLEAGGHRVFVPTMMGSGARAHLMSSDLTIDALIADIALMLDESGLRDVTLVGHSFGGAIISGVAERCAGVVDRLLFLDAAVLENGESMLGRLTPEVAARRLKMAEREPGGMSIPIPSCADLGVHDPDLCRTLKPKLTPQPLASYTSAITLNDRPGAGYYCHYITCTEPLYAPLAWARERAHAYGWPMTEITTGHDAMLTDPEGLTTTILEIARPKASKRIRR